MPNLSLSPHWHPAAYFSSPAGGRTSHALTRDYSLLTLSGAKPMTPASDPRSPTTTAFPGEHDTILSGSCASDMTAGGMAYPAAPQCRPGGTLAFRIVNAGGGMRTPLDALADYRPSF